MRLGTLPIDAKPGLMRWSWLWYKALSPLWRRWYQAWYKLPLWREGAYDAGDVTYWRGVKLVCCTDHYAGTLAEHPWDPGAGWLGTRRGHRRFAALWEPATGRDRILLRLVGDPRRSL